MKNSSFTQALLKTRISKIIETPGMYIYMFRTGWNHIFRVPAIPYADKMASKSNTMVIAVSNDDPATTKGATDVMLNLLRYVPETSPCGQVRQRTIVNGDQGFVSLCRKAVDSRTEVSDPKERLSPLLPLPQDWHACKVFTQVWKKLGAPLHWCLFLTGIEHSISPM